MTHTGPVPDSAGDFSGWRDHPQACNRLVPVTSGSGTALFDNPTAEKRLCGAKVQVRTWESSDGAYEDYQYRCEAGHSWWIDGIDS